MCCCEKPNVNGTPGYSWDGKSVMTYHVNPPALREHDELLYDLPGRCGGLDSHSHHLRVVKPKYGDYTLLVRHGGGDEALSLSYSNHLVKMLEPMDDNARYFFLIRLYHVVEGAERKAIERTDAKWRLAAAEKRIKTRKQRGTNLVKVSITPKVVRQGLTDAN